MLNDISVLIGYFLGALPSTVCVFYLDGFYLEV